VTGLDQRPQRRGGQHPPPIGGRTLADELRDDLARCEVWVTRIGAEVDGLALLRLLDRITDELERLEQRGVDLRAERGRLESVLGQLRQRRKVLVAQVGTVLTARRPVEARWWWYLDEQVAADRRRLFKWVVVGTLVGMSLLALAYLLYDRVLAPPPHVRQANAHVFEGEQAVTGGDLARAIEQFEAAAALDPENAEAYLWLGVLYQTTGDVDQATIALERARAFFSTKVDFFLQRGLFYLALNEVDAAEEDALAAVQVAPERPEGYFLLGSVAEQMGDLELAMGSFQRASELAEAIGNAELMVNARIRLATVLETLMAMPEQ
jgi:tetratricopeptide (TPR) repeat protein